MNQLVKSAGKDKIVSFYFVLFAYVCVLKLAIFLITNQFNDQLPFGLLAQLVRALHLYWRGQDPNPVQT